MEEWIPYDKILIDTIYVIDKTFYSDDGILEIDLIDGRIEGNKEKKIKLIFKDVFSYNYSDEDGMLERFSKIGANILRKNSIFKVKNKAINEKDYHFIVMDEVDNIVEIFNKAEPDIVY